MAILGNKEVILGFKALGISTYSLTTIEEGIAHLADIEQAKNIGILFITEDWAETLEEEIEKRFSKAALPAIVAIPSPTGTTGAGLKRIKKYMEQAIGSDIFSE